MPNIKIDGKEYDLDKLSKQARAQVASLQFVDLEMQRTRDQLAVLKTAKMAYLNALKQQLAESAAEAPKKH